jgi:hypothetical protein
MTIVEHYIVAIPIGIILGAVVMYYLTSGPVDRE